ncbi:histidine phosphatase family protein [Blautia sp.]|uniref:histidine phosphatase family protein n=1 Tax=Blautia sp. TaxID=1955243 RepID=UPI0025BDDF32|nr:histidine phosphatase family protein [Blautia sp.]
MTTFYVVRHGETLLNSIGRAQGWSDSPLTDNGKRTAAELGAELNGIIFNAAYTSDMIRAEQTAKLILSMSGNDNIEIQKDIRLREWCLGSMEAEHNSLFIQTVSDWLGVSSFAELNKRLSDVARAIYEHDTTGAAEPFEDISSRLKNVFTDIAQSKLRNENSNILIVTHAFAIKTLIYLFAPEKLCAIDKVKNVTTLKLLYNGNRFYFKE